MSIHWGGRSFNSRWTKAVIAEPTLALNFAIAGPLDPRVTFARASSGTYFNSSGVLSTATTDTPRFDYDPNTLAAKGLLIEEQRSNLALYSEQFDNAAWPKVSVTVTSNQIMSPDGTNSADKVASTVSGTTLNGVYQVITAATGLTLSVFAKAGTAGFLGITTNTSGNSYANFNLSNGTVTSSGGCIASIVNCSDGWYRCIMANTTDAGAGYIIITPKDADPAGNPWSNGTCLSGNYIYIWGAQLEAGSF